MRGFAFLFRHLPRVQFALCRLTGTNYEREMDLLDVLCDPGRTSVDIGAKVGMYTYRIRAQSADVVAFEPIPMFANMLDAVFRGKRARVERVALSDREGSAMLRLPYGKGKRMELGRSTIEAHNELTHECIEDIEQLEVPTRTLDSYALGNVGFIKVDVEGHELAVLAGAEQTIATHKPNLLIECNDEHYPDAVATLAAWLAAHDYIAVFIDRRELHDIATYDRDQHWVGRDIENFICIHRSRGEVMARLVARVATRRLGPHLADRSAPRPV